MVHALKSKTGMPEAYFMQLQKQHENIPAGVECCQLPYNEKAVEPTQHKHKDVSLMLQRLLRVDTLMCGYLLMQEMFLALPKFEMGNVTCTLVWTTFCEL